MIVPKSYSRKLAVTTMLDWFMFDMPTPSWQLVKRR
jgi:hypothetical protein